MTTSRTPSQASAAPLAGKVVWWSAIVSSIFLASGVWFAYLDDGLSRPFVFTLKSGTHDRSTLCFAVGIGILLALPVLRDLFVIGISLRHSQRAQAILATIGAGGLFAVYAFLWLST